MKLDTKNRKQLNPEYVRQRVSNLAKLSTLPHLASKVMELVENPKTSASTLAKILSADQILTARILKLANSAYYGFPRKISTLNLAIVVLGFNALRDLVLSISIIDQFGIEAEKNFRIEQFWRHALVVGRGARLLSRYVNYPVAGEVFVAGLLHDIGYPVMIQQFPDYFKDIFQYASEVNIPFHQAELQVLGFDHTQVGSWLAEGWNLPEKLVYAIRYHHTPERARLHHDLVNIIHIADLICYSIGEGSGINRMEGISTEEIEQKMKALFTRNGYPLTFYQDKFRQEAERIEEFLNIIHKKEMVE